MRSLGWAQYNMTGVLIRRGKYHLKTDTRGEEGHLKMGAGRSYAATSQGQLEVGYQTPEGVRDTSPVGPQGQHGSASTLLLDFWPPELWESIFLLFWANQFEVTCGSSPGKFVQPSFSFFHFSKWEKWKLQKKRNSPEITQLIHSTTRIRTQLCWLWAHYLYHFKVATEK